MEVFWATLLLATTFLGIAIAGIAIKIWAKKDGEFAGTCASNSCMRLMRKSCSLVKTWVVFYHYGTCSKRRAGRAAAVSETACPRSCSAAQLAAQSFLQNADSTL